MGVPASTRRVLRFGEFAADPRIPELQKNGTRIKLQEQPFQILCMLLDQPGQLVTREEMRARLWPADTFVDFDVALNTAIKKLRDALGDSAEAPRYIETIPRRGYRFICPVSDVGIGAAPPDAPATTWWTRRWAVISLIASVCLLAIAVLVETNVDGLRDRLLGHRISGKTLKVAVLPLRDLSGGPEQEYFAAGMTEMLITELGRIPALQVTSHQSVFGYAQSSKPVPQIARELEVDAVLEGTVQRANNRIRVTVNFVQAQPENHLLAESFDKDARDVFGVQQDVARAIAAAVRANLPRPAASAARSIIPEAVEAFLRGTYLLAKGTDTDRDQARVAFEQAIEIDPNFARPYAYLAVMYAHGGAIRAGGGGEGRKLTRQWAEKALQLDDSLAEAHTALGWLAISDWDFKNAEREFKRAIELNPSYATARAWYAQFLGSMQRYPEAFVQGEMAMQLAPGDPVIVSHAVEPYINGGRVDEAIAHWKTTLEIQPDYWGAHYFLALAFMKKGLHRDAVAEAEETIRLGEHSSLNLSLLASVYATAGNRDKALSILSELEAGSSGKATARPGEVALARVYAALGERDRALALLERAYQAHGPGLAFINTWPQFDALRSDPRFRDLVRRVGLPVAEVPAAQTASGSGPGLQ